MISLISMSYLSFFPVFNIEFYYFYRKQPVIPAKKSIFVFINDISWIVKNLQ